MVQLLSAPHLGNTVLSAGPAQFGHELKSGQGVSQNLQMEKIDKRRKQRISCFWKK